MAGWRQAIELALSEEEVTRLTAVTRSRTEPASRVERARMLLAYREDGSFFAVARAIGVHHQTVQRCVERALAFGAMAALNGLPQGQGARLSPRIVDDAAARGPCARTRAARGARLPGQACSGHAVHHPQRAGDQASQGPLLPGTP